MDNEMDAQRALQYLALAEQYSDDRQGLKSALWLARLEAEHDGLISALQWLIGNGDSEKAQRLCCAFLWNERGRITEGRTWLAQVLAMPGPPTKARAAALYRAGELAWRQCDIASSKSINRELMSIAQHLADKRSVISATGGLARVAVLELDFASANAFADEGMKIAEELGAKRGLVAPLHMLGYVARNAGSFKRAGELFEASLALNKEFGLLRMIALENYNTGHLALHAQDTEQASSLFSDSLQLLRLLGHIDLMSNSLMGCAAVAAAQGSLENAAQLLGAGQAQFQRLGVIPDPADRLVYDSSLASTRAGLDEETFTANYATGHAMTLKQAVEYALQDY